MTAPSRIAGLVLIEAALPEPVALVTVRTAGPDRERGHFFPTAEEARAFASGVAEQRGLMLIDLVAADEGAER
ncbi:MAG: hypothetical protein K2Q29_11840 [Sphingomonadales bacterium]|nr:hypothetical protein [Sphingomonadales bacterium]